jgi:hypothetical protein
MTTTEVILSEQDISDLINGLDFLVGAIGDQDMQQIRLDYQPGTEARDRVRALIDRLIAAKDLRTKLEF